MKEKPPGLPLDNNGEVMPFVLTPDGEIREFSELVKERSNEKARPFSSLLLQNGDTLVLKEDRGKNGVKQNYLFEISKTSWAHLEMGGDKPRSMLQGKLKGSNLPKSAQNLDVTFVGSSVSSSTITPGEFIPGQHAIFFSNTEHPRDTAEIAFSFNDTIVISKNDAGQDAIVPMSLLESERKREVPRHGPRLEFAQAIMETYGLNTQCEFTEFVDSKTSMESRQEFEDENVHVVFSPGLGQGNVLSIHDKKNERWIQFQYYNADGSDILKVAHASLQGEEIDNLYRFSSITDTSVLNRAKIPHTTFVTSENLGFEAVAHKPAGIPISPDIESYTVCITPDENPTISETYPYRLSAEVIAKAESKLSYKDPDEEGNMFLSIDGKEIQLENPDQMIEDILERNS